MGLNWTMKLWVSLTTCLIVLSAVHASPPRRNTPSAPTKRRIARASESPLDLPPVQISVSINTGNTGTSRLHIDTSHGEGAIVEEQYTMEELLPEQYENVVDFIKVTVSRIRRSPVPSTSLSKQDPSSRTRHRRERKKSVSQRSRGGGVRGGEVERKGGGGGRGGGSGRGQGCVLKQIHLNVSDLGLGYKSQEEMIFRYCSGPCRKSETNYDKILNNLTKNKKFPPKDRPPHTCCRPIAFDDDISFLDDNLIYHTMRKHSARKCGCV